jgi:hypothetical protein
MRLDHTMAVTMTMKGSRKLEAATREIMGNGK